MHNSFTVFGKGALKFINPLEGTTDVIRGIHAGEMGYKNLTNMAKASRTFGAFYRDVRNGWFSIGESKMEGGGGLEGVGGIGEAEGGRGEGEDFPLIFSECCLS